MNASSDFLKHTALQLDLWGEQFATLEQKVKRSAQEGRETVKHRLAKLRGKKRSLKRRLREAAHGSTEVEWEDVRGELEEAVHEFRSLAARLHHEVEKV